MFTKIDFHMSIFTISSYGLVLLTILFSAFSLQANLFIYFHQSIHLYLSPSLFQSTNLLRAQRNASTIVGMHKRARIEHSV